MSELAPSSAKRVNRADLLRALKHKDQTMLAATAEMYGFKAPAKPKLKVKLPHIEVEKDKKNKERADKSQPQTKPKAEQPTKNEIQYYRVIDREQSELLPEIVHKDQQPDLPWLNSTDKLDPSQIKPLAVIPPEKEPLVVWEKLWPVLRALLSEFIKTQQADIPKIVRTIANGYWLEKVPRKMRRRWSINVQVLVDRPERTNLFNQDYNRFLAQLKQLRGTTGLTLLRILRRPGGRVRAEAGQQSQIREWVTPEFGTKILILSDLGLLDESGISQRAWVRLGQQLKLAGCQAIALLPLPARYLTTDLANVFDCISWDRNSPLEYITNTSTKDQNNKSSLEQDTKKAEDLLAWLSPAVRIEPALLRAVRYQLPKQNFDVGQEAAAWHHKDVIRSSIGFNFQPQKKIIEKYRKRFKQLKEKYPETTVRIAKLILDYHKHVFPTQRDEELLLLAQLLENDLPEEQSEVQQAQQRMRELIKTGLSSENTLSGIRPFLMHLIERQHLEMVDNHDFYQTVWGVKQASQNLLMSKEELPEGFDPKNVLAFVDHNFDEEKNYVLYQQGSQELQLSTKEQFESADDSGFFSGSALAHFTTASSVMFHQLTKAGGKQEKRLLKLGDDAHHVFPLKQKEVQQVDIAGESLTIERFYKPKWANSIKYSSDNVITAKSGDVDYAWVEPRVVKQNKMSSAPMEAKIMASIPETATHRGFWCPRPSQQMINNPADWAVNIGNDQYGLWVDAYISGIEHRFRWIEPTSFMMGSPKDEKGRYDNETQHEVILTQGYWLAETTCTQELWQAVMGSNPSEFKGENKPVDNVSWEDINNQFLVKLNKQQPELALRLPTEAEWENACRAGTTAAFNFEKEISLDQFNYRGTWDDYHNYGEGALKQTAEVKKYQPNHWGLYQMHGNVWEWCNDWYGDYPAKQVIDPTGSESGTLRVLRGGSWIYDGRNCRSAGRGYWQPDFRDSLIGFRLARGQRSSVQSVRAKRL